MSVETTSVALLRALVDGLDSRGIAYCHWKSNMALARSKSMPSDLDLLIRRADSGAFMELLASLGFKEARPARGEELPSVLHFYGHDERAEQPIHVHAHFTLIVGHDRTKGFRLPLEDVFLDRATRLEFLRVPPAELELLVFVIRMALKYFSWEAILGGQGRVPRACIEELAFLEAKVDPAALERARSEWLPFVDGPLFAALSRALRGGASMWARMRAASRLHRCLRAHARRSRPRDVALKLARRVSRSVRRRLGRGLPRMRLASGGAMIALVGGDGAGKSTALGDLHDWLRKDLDVRRYHLGRPPRSLTTHVVRAVLKSARSVASRNAFGDPVVSRMVWSVCAARDRYRAYAKARRFANNGGLAFCDRFPLPNIRLMDAPGVEAIGRGRARPGLVAVLSRLESRWYAPIVFPETVIVLRLDPEIAVRRKTEEKPESVRERSREIWETDWSGTRVLVVDASLPREAVLAQLKSMIWSRL